MMSCRQARLFTAALLGGLVWCASAGLAGQTAPPQISRDARPALPPPAGTAVMAGTVVSSDLGRGVARARVVLSGGDQRVTRTALSDAQGQFNFTQLGPGEYTLQVSKPGYLDSQFGQKQPGSGRPGTAIRLAAGQRMERIALTLARGGVITGIVRDEAGEPAFGTQVRVFRWVMRSGERTLQASGGATTDDRGVYRAAVLQPGEYVVSATPRQDLESIQFVEMRMRVEELAMVARATLNDQMLADAKMAAARAGEVEAQNTGPSTGYAPVYYPGTTQASGASSVPVAIGEERSGIDLQLQLVPTSRVAGTVMGPDGPMQGGTVQLIDHSAPPGLGSRTSRSAADGRFTFTAVPPGQYTLIARASPRGARPLEASVREAAETLAHAATEARAAAVAAAISGAAQLWGQVDVMADGRDQPNVLVTLQPGMTISGSVVFEGGSGPPPNLSRMSLTLAPVGQAAGGEMALAPPGPVDANGRFTIRGVMPGRYRIVPSAGVPSSFTIRSSVFAGRDTLDFPLEVKPGEDHAGGVLTFSTSTSELAGTLQDATGQPAQGFTVVAFSADERFWTPQSRRVQAARPATDGRFAFRALPPGDYRLVAVTDVEPGQWFDPAFLRQLVGGSVPLSIADGERKVQDLRVR
jgi:hypothetical protein